MTSIYLTARRARMSLSLCALLAVGASLVTALVLGLTVLAVTTAALLATLAASTARLRLAERERTRQRRHRRAPLIRIAFSITSLSLGGAAAVRRLLRPEYVFVVYAEDEREKRLCTPKWAEPALRLVLPLGLLRFGRYWGMVVAGKVTAQSLEHSPEKMQQLLDCAREDFPKVQAIALAGRLPSIAVKNGLSLDRPFLRGDRGTVCAMMGSAREQAQLLGKPANEVIVAVPGGAGFVGTQVVQELGREFQSVIAVDPRYEGRRHAEGRVLYTDRPEDVAPAEAILVLTARGEETVGIVPFLRPGVIVADDTYPEIPESIRKRMEAAGATVLKATVGDSRFRLLPRFPFFRSDDIPGCLLEALVVVQRGHDVLASQRAFNAAARELGFRTRLAPHIASGARL